MNSEVIETEGKDCETCGQGFAARVVVCLGCRIVARHCAACVQAHLADQAKRASRPVQPPPTREELWARLCPPEFRTAAEGGKTSLDRMTRECQPLRAVLAWRYGDRGLMLRGATGAGKTRAMWRLLRRLFEEGRTLEVMTAGELGRSYADAAGQYQSSAWFERMTGVEVLFIDDLGKGCWSEAVRAVFFDLVDKRMRNGLPVLITTNDNGTELSERMRDVNLGDPLVRRLREFCEVISFEASRRES